MEKSECDPQALMKSGFDLIDADHDEKIAKGDIIAYYARQHVDFDCDFCFEGCENPETPRSFSELQQDAGFIVVVFIFVALDKDLDGQLSFEEWKPIGLNWSSEDGPELRQVFEKSDINKDGKLNLKEFVNTIAPNSFSSCLLS